MVSFSLAKTTLLLVVTANKTKADKQPVYIPTKEEKG
jgi:hypothetical protein